VHLDPLGDHAAIRPLEDGAHGAREQLPDRPPEQLRARVASEPLHGRVRADEPELRVEHEVRVGRGLEDALGARVRRPGLVGGAGERVGGLA
jgi:hypothetical protein